MSTYYGFGFGYAGFSYNTARFFALVTLLIGHADLILRIFLAAFLFSGEYLCFLLVEVIKGPFGLPFGKGDFKILAWKHWFEKIGLFIYFLFD